MNILHQQLQFTCVFIITIILIVTAELSDSCVYQSFCKNLLDWVLYIIIYVLYIIVYHAVCVGTSPRVLSYECK